MPLQRYDQVLQLLGLLMFGSGLLSRLRIASTVKEDAHALSCEGCWLLESLWHLSCYVPAVVCTLQDSHETMGKAAF